MAKPDLNKLKDEIDSRKRQKNISPSSLGESVGVGVSPRDVFLNGLLESRNTGRDTVSSNLVKIVNNKVADKKGETNKLSVNEIAPVRQTTNNRTLPIEDDVNMSVERDEQLYADLDKKRKQTIAESMQEFIKPNIVNSGLSQMKPQNLNEQYLVENVKKIVNEHLIENFGSVVEEAIKSTIIEMYAVERIKEVLHENKEMIKSLVYETIREIQAKSKAKARS